MSSITGLAAIAALNAFENEMLNVSELVKETNYDAKILHIESKCFSTSDCNKFANNILDTKIKNKKLINESFVS